ncbi:uncharacterized protein Nmag_2079 [Natrialba magadii ATCC 43099]|uniref:Transmembrane protein n=1 Tax=Natrialba magadii (strain ATCC 43099 / DSM 3394 / CCM 3739 / CIP 104546 / IAM 13178 / JCM 8861 / NBRC 102185 / NCIMB 2190 / MS3) TaxID=547559 RepID=D3SVY7_NATMM|nr:hypothetical protein [Natrialba magadii]ADD05648.1 uncharacterized protein Nmag_2079 [Natrialba magadii ATCC 43099]ELY29940.1 hypothetical protein C500_10029 [Natrialba magadii ATCC 43099]
MATRRNRDDGDSRENQSDPSNPGSRLDYLDQLRYEGETEQRRVALESATVVVTSHRVLAVDHDGSSGRGTTGTDSRPYRHVDRPNVQHVAVSTGGSPANLYRTLLAGALGLTLLTISLATSFAAMVPTVALESDEASGDGAGAGVESETAGSGAETAAGAESGTDIATTAAVDGLFETFGLVFQVLDLVVLVGGLLSLGLAAVFATLYVRSRSERLRIEVAGEADIELPLSRTDDGRVTALSLREAIQPGSPIGGQSLAATSGGVSNGDRDRDRDDHSLNDEFGPGNGW